MNGHSPPSYFSLIDFLITQDFVDQHPRNASDQEFATFYSQDLPTSRIDLIWFSGDIFDKAFCFDRVWQLPSSLMVDGPSSLMKLDHRCVISYFAKSLFVSDLPLHRVKQKQEWRSFYDVKNATSE